MRYNRFTMNKSTFISKISTVIKDKLAPDEEDVSVIYRDNLGNLKMLLHTEYDDMVSIFTFGMSDTHIRYSLPYVVYHKKYEDADFEHIICEIPEGENFFEADFSYFNYRLSINGSRHFIFEL